jgi:CheY-like chemotaxis protein
MGRTVLAIVDDMFFASKIRATGEAIGVTLSFPRSQELLLQKAREATPDLILIDLHHQRFDPLEAAARLKADPELRGIRLLAFFSHVQTDLQHSAVAAGVDQVIPRSVFSRDLAMILSGQR